MVVYGRTRNKTVRQWIKTNFRICFVAGICELVNEFLVFIVFIEHVLSFFFDFCFRIKLIAMDVNNIKKRVVHDKY